jgi:hypothetical protein
MKLGYSIVAAAGLAGALFFADAPKSALAGDDLSSKFKVTATEAGGKVDILITPADDSVFINSEYPIKISLAGKDGGSVSKSALTKDDGKYVASSHEGKAKSVEFKVDAPKGVTGDGKLVVCSLEACGNPTKFHFESKK